MNARFIFVSNNFRFGNKREGDVKLLISYETIAGFSIITDIEYDGESIDKGDYSTTTKEISLNVNQN